MSRSLASILALASLPFAAPALAAEPKAEPTADAHAYDFTLALTSGLSDVGLLFGFRVNDHFGWSFDVGASLRDDEVGLSLGLDLAYFVAEDFRGFFVGFGGEVATVASDFGDGIARSGRHAITRASFGYKAILGPGITVITQMGPALLYDENETASGTVTSSLRPGLDARLALGWTF
ncbi:MAG: hypothetical protein U1F43_35945 [Myxococcota bacterium]